MVLEDLQNAAAAAARCLKPDHPALQEDIEMSH